MESQTEYVDGWEWPDGCDDMAVDEKELELPVPEEEPPIPFVPWEERQELQNVKAKRLCELSRETHQGHYYASLPNSEIDWFLEGRNICRIDRCPFYGLEFEPPCCLEAHLHNATHRRLDAWYQSEEAVFPPGPRFPRVPPLDNNPEDEVIEGLPGLSSMGLTQPKSPTQEPNP